MRQKIKIFALAILVLAAAAGCADRPLKLQTDGIGQKEGILVAGTFGNSRSLWFTSGISVRVGDSEIIDIPWAESRFIGLPAGSHSFEIWYGWFGRRSSVAKGCFRLNQGQVVYIEYRPQGRAAEGKADMLDLNSRKKMDYDEKCQ